MVCAGVVVSARSGSADAIERITAHSSAAAIEMVDRLLFFIVFRSEDFTYGTSKVFGTGRYDADGAPSGWIGFPAVPVTAALVASDAAGTTEVCGTAGTATGES